MSPEFIFYDTIQRLISVELDKRDLNRDPILNSSHTSMCSNPSNLEIYKLKALRNSIVNNLFDFV